MGLRLRRSMLWCLFGLMACSEMGTLYFQHGVNDATAELVARRYGPPHKLDRRQDGGMVWTYFDRGSGSVGYSGVGRASYCHKYVLTFDPQEVLRDWQQQECHD
jgi:hypothetical protein